MEALDFVTDLGVYTINGLLIMAYWLLGHVAHMVSIASILAFLFIFAPLVQEQAAFKPARAGETVRAHPRQTYQILVLVTGALWLWASLLYPQPVPWLGAAMWLMSVMILLLLPMERQENLWRTATSILTYSLVLLGFKWYLGRISAMSPVEWAKVLGTVGEAKRVIAGNAGIFTTVGTWAAWFILPLAHASYVVQRLLVHPMSVASPFASAAQILEEIRTRGG